MNYKLYSLLLLTVAVCAMDNKDPHDTSSAEVAMDLVLRHIAETEAAQSQQSTPAQQSSEAAGNNMALAPLRLTRAVPKQGSLILRGSKKQNGVGVSTSQLRREKLINLADELAQLRTTSPAEFARIDQMLSMPTMHEDWHYAQATRCVSPEHRAKLFEHTAEILVTARFKKYHQTAYSVLGELIKKITEIRSRLSNSAQMLEILVSVHNILGNSNYIVLIATRPCEKLTKLRTVCLSVKGLIDFKKNEYIGNLYNQFIDSIEQLRNAVLVLTGHTAPFIQAFGSCCLFKESLITGSHDLTARIWDLDSWEKPQTKMVIAPGTLVRQSAHRIAADAAIDVAAHTIRIVKDLIYEYIGQDYSVLQLSKPSRYGRSLVLSGHKTPLSAVQLSPDGKYAVTGSVDGLVLCWNLVTKKAGKIEHNGPINNIEFVLKNNRYVCATHTILGQKKLWDPKNGKIVQQTESLAPVLQANSQANNIVTFDAEQLDLDPQTLEALRASAMPDLIGDQHPD